jgi:hypothetical protein
MISRGRPQQNEESRAQADEESRRNGRNFARIRRNPRRQLIDIGWVAGRYLRAPESL